MSTDTAKQRQTAAAREALAATFSTPEEKSQHYRRLAEKANTGRLVLSPDEGRALGEACGLLARIAKRHQLVEAAS